MNQEQEIEKTLNMADRIGRVTPSDELRARLKSIPQTVKQGYDLVPKKIIWATAASIALLVCLNLFYMNRYKKVQNYESESVTTETTDAYFSYLKTM